MARQICSLLLVSFLLLGMAHAQPAVLDIDTHKAGLAAQNFVEIDGTLYFSGFSAATGFELYRLGQDDNPVLIADINPGKSSSYPDGLVALGDKLVFTAWNKDSGMELYSYSGSGAPVMVPEIRTGKESTVESNLVHVGNRVYFIAQTATEPQLYWTDGSITTQVILSPINQPLRYANHLMPFGDRLLVFASANGDNHMVVFNPADNTFVNLGDHTPGTYAYDNQPAVYGDQVFFTAMLNGYDDLYRFDGTLHEMDLTVDGKHVNSISEVVTLGDRIYFAGWTETTGKELFYLDQAGAHLAADVIPGADGSHPESLFSDGSRLFFTAVSPEKRFTEVYVFENGSAKRWSTVQANKYLPFMWSAKMIDGSHYFTSFDFDRGTQIFTISGNQAAPLTDFSDATLQSNVHSLHADGGGLVFAAFDVPGPYRIVEYDGSAFTARGDLFLDNATRHGVQNVRLGSKIVFLAQDPNTGESNLYVDDGEDVTRVTDLSGISKLAVVNGKVYFVAGQDVFSAKMYSYDGSAVTPVSAITVMAPGNPIAFKGALYFSGMSLTDGMELFTFNGTTQSLVGGGLPGMDGTTPMNLTVVGDELYFWGAKAGGDETAVYVTDGTDLQMIDVKRTVVCIDQTQCFSRIGDKLYFTSVNDAEDELDLVEYDLTTSTSMVITSSTLSGDEFPPRYLTAFDDKLYFSGSDANGGNELMVWDGETLSMAADIYPGDQHSMPIDLVVFGGKLYFSAESPEHGRELMSLSASGTVATEDPAGVGGWVLEPAYPNPAGQVVRFVFSAPQAADVQIGLYDLLGRRVRQVAGGSFAAGPHTVTFDVSDLPAGAYFIRLLSGRKQLVQKIAVTH